MNTAKITNTSDDPILLKIIERIVSAYHPTRLYLFGSQAAGNQNEDSDYDVVILVDDSAKSEFKSPTLAYKSLSGIQAAVDVLVWTEQEFQKRLHIPNSLPYKVVNEGVLLHAA